MARRPVLITTAAAAGVALGVFFGALAVLRHGRPLHPKGVLFDAVVRRTGGTRRWEVPWLDEPGEHHGTARLSRAAGLPAPVPDVCGLAVTFVGQDGDRHDLLLASTGLRPGLRLMLLPRVDPRSVPYTSLLPYRSPAGPVVLAAVPTPAGDRAGGTLTFRLLAAGLTGPWDRFGELELTERPGVSDAALRFDPVEHLLPGLSWAPWLARLREPAYAAARRTPVTASGADTRHRTTPARNP